MPRRDELAQMLQAARLYYEDNRTQAQIARALKTSRPTVSRLLQQARQEGIVQIRIVDPNSTHSALEEQLLAAFPLVEAIVVSVESDAVNVTRHRIGQAAARYLERTLQNGDRVGIGWGRTLSE
ncbi:MAG: helix-turn-helix domain-containing protein, partial [Anaerolineae bacterium]|nr:helix-turn-helix domain-containing protein [Anaerolineae bacterium]